MLTFSTCYDIFEIKKQKQQTKEKLMNKAIFLPQNAKKLFKENSVNGNKNFYLDINFGNETIAKVKHLPNDVLVAEIENETTFGQVISIYNKNSILVA